MCRTWAGSYVDRGHRWKENENFIKLRLHFCCGGSKALLHATIYRLGRWPSSWLANSTPANWACRSTLNGHSGWLTQPPAQPQHLDLSGTALSPRLWPNRRVATLLVCNILHTDRHSDTRRIGRNTTSLAKVNTSEDLLVCLYVCMFAD